MTTTVTTTARPAADVYDVPVASIAIDEQRFQTRRTFAAGGVSGQLSDLERFGREAAGIVSLWRDPADGLDYAIDGHNRLDLARRCGEVTIRAQFLDEPTATAARLRGALINMQARNFNAFDVANVLRDTGWTEADLTARGVPLRDRETRDGLDLAQLHPAVFTRTVRGDLTQKRGAMIGRLLTDHAAQLALVALLDEPKRANLTDGEVEQLIRFTCSAGQTTTEQVDLFGSARTTKSLAVERAQIAAAIRERLVGDRRLFGYVSNGARAARLADEGSRIDKARSVRVATDAAQLLELFDRLAHRTGPLGEVLTAAARRVAAGEHVAAVAADVYAPAIGTLTNSPAPAAPVAPARPAVVATANTRTLAAKRGERRRVPVATFRRLRGLTGKGGTADLATTDLPAVLTAARGEGLLADMVHALLVNRLVPDVRRALETWPLD